ncbi:flagellin [Nocardioides sp.]|uniref:flagellin N-terminal helical domain-containing protein n=1 Tax=Nocardioides sp. TaxID=35761 RepID=UPI0025E52FF0|nr:flagellin [Nocardioides sp.]
MSLRINQNIDALNSYRNLSVTQGQMSKSLEKLSSGYRINRAADDAAGLAISEGLRSQVGGLKVAVRNTQDGISVVQTAEGALTETHSILQRMRDLSVQASNGGALDSNAKDNIQSEIGQLKSELNRITDTTKFSGQNLLDGSYNGRFQVGANAGENIDVQVTQNMSASGLGVSNVDVRTGAYGDSAALGSIDFADTTAGGPAMTVDTGAGALTLDLSDWAVGGDADAAAKNLALVQSELTKKLEGTGWNAAVNEFGGVDFSSADSAATIDFTVGGASVVSGTVAATASGGAEAAITAIDDAIKTVSTTRANLGAVQNRFEHTVNNLNVAVENLSASESRIRDTDMAAEMMNFTRSQILSQAGTAMLAQANQAPQGVLSLLR